MPSASALERPLAPGVQTQLMPSVSALSLLRIVHTATVESFARRNYHSARLPSQFAAFIAACVHHDTAGDKKKKRAENEESSDFLTVVISGHRTVATNSGPGTSGAGLTPIKFRPRHFGSRADPHQVSAQALWEQGRPPCTLHRYGEGCSLPQHLGSGHH